MKKIYLILLAAIGLTMTSCLMEEKELFDQTPAERMEAYLEGYRTLLAESEGGWLLQYYPEENQSYGGYAYILKFTKDSVTAYFQLANNTEETVSSLYKMTPDDGPVITFDTYNEYIHYFATPDIQNYEAMHGDYEFRIVGKNADASELYMKGKRTNNSYTLVKFTGNPAEYLDKANEVQSGMTAPAYKMVMGEDTTSCSISGNVFQYNYNVYTEADTTSVSGSMAFCYTPEGLDFYEPVVINGTEYTSLVYNAEEGTLSSEDGKIVINQVIPPINQFFVLSDWYITFSNIGSWGQPYFNAAKQALTSIGEELLLAYMGKTATGNWGFGFYSTDGTSNYRGSLDYNYQLIGEDKIAMQFAMSGDNNGVWYHNNASFSYMLNVFGYSSTRTFTVSADDKKAPSYILLTEDANPKNTIKLIPTQTLYPFNN